MLMSLLNCMDYRVLFNNFYVLYAHFEFNFYEFSLRMINRIYNWSPMQTEKSQPEEKRIMPEMRFIEFPALSVDPRIGISRSAHYFSYLCKKKFSSTAKSRLTGKKKMFLP